MFVDIKKGEAESTQGLPVNAAGSKRGPTKVLGIDCKTLQEKLRNVLSCGRHGMSTIWIRLDKKGSPFTVPVSDRLKLVRRMICVQQIVTRKGSEIDFPLYL